MPFNTTKPLVVSHLKWDSWWQTVLLTRRRTFYTHDDFLQIKAAGLTAVRIPLGYWAVDLLDFEPYVSGQGCVH